MDPAKIKIILDWPEPKTTKNVQEFLGFTNFNRQFITNYSKIAIPLTRLTRKDETFTWGPAQKQAFEQLKDLCTTPPVLVTFVSGEPLRFETDASGLAMGACAKQLRNGKWHPLEYYSRTFTGPEQRYDVHDLELFAIVLAFKHWRTWAHSCSDLEVLTDHRNLTRFTTTKELTPRQARWAEYLGQFKFKITYTPGRDNGRADALSRRSDLVGEKEITRAAILRTNPDGSLGPANELNNMLAITNDVPEESQEAIIRQHHDDPVHGHPGIKRTMELIQRNYSFKNMKEKVTQYVKKCTDCQKNKHATHARYGEQQAMDIPTTPWDDIAMDFVTGLPESKDPVTELKYNAILVIVCRLTKYAIFIPFRKDYNAEQLGYVILDRLVRDHGIPKTIVSDRDKLFTSNYWTALMAAIGTKRKLSTAYHPQTDGQTERTNQTMQTYLRIYSNQRKNNWVSLLPMAQLAYNNKQAESTGMTPFYANHGKHPNLFERSFPTMKTEAALATADKLKETLQLMRENLQKAQQQSISYVNQKRKMAPQLKEGDKVYLLTKNLRTKRKKHKKLDHVKVGPFLISEQRGPVNYKLKLPKDARIHPVFHVSLLEPADPETPLQTTFHYKAEEDDEFEVERIIGHSDTEPGSQGKRLFLVKWKGYDLIDNTWEPEEHLTNCQQMVQDYYERLTRSEKNIPKLIMTPPYEYTLRKERSLKKDPIRWMRS